IQTNKMKQIIFLVLLTTALNSEIINKQIVDHLKKVAPFEVCDPEENHFKDWTREEIRAMLGTKRRPSPIQRDEKIELNDEYDFRTAHPECVTGVRDQGECGSCWAFAGVMSLQQRFCVKSSENNKVLSPQDPISCNKENEACLGGYIDLLWDYMYMVGVVEDDCLPYTAYHGHLEECVADQASADLRVNRVTGLHHMVQ
ncbi:MAG: hypothetical protein MJY84_00545, partial [Bacteroidales bacterium]|nr:hypothetical protein [Bacteroidales bacterium]